MWGLRKMTLLVQSPTLWGAKDAFKEGSAIPLHIHMHSVLDPAMVPACYQFMVTALP